MADASKDTCIPNGFQAAIASAVFPVSLLTLVTFASHLRNRFLPFFGFNVERRILASILLSHGTFCTSVPLMVLPGMHVSADSRVCATLRKIGEVTIYSYLCCTFIGYMMLTLNRYIRCEFAIFYMKIVTIPRLNLALISKWILAYTINLTAAFASKRPSLFTLFVSYRKSSVYSFAAVYFISTVVVFVANLRLWMVAHNKRRVDHQRVTQNRSDSRKKNPPDARKQYKVAAILFSLTLKNIICFLPFVVMILTGEKACQQMQIIGPITASSPLLDPWIYLLMNKSVRGQVRNS